MPRNRPSLLLVVSLLSIIYFQSSVSKTRSNNSDNNHLMVPRHRRSVGFTPVRGNSQVRTAPFASNNVRGRGRVAGVGKRRVRHSGRLLGRPNPIKCARRPRTVKDGSSGHYYFFSDDTNYRVSSRLHYKREKSCTFRTRLILNT